jgi:hypothetical protein
VSAACIARDDVLLMVTFVVVLPQVVGLRRGGGAGVSAARTYELPLIVTLLVVLPQVVGLRRGGGAGVSSARIAQTNVADALTVKHTMLCCRRWLVCGVVVEQACRLRTQDSPLPQALTS